MTINPKGLRDGVGRFTLCRPFGYLLANFNPKFGPADFDPLGLRPGHSFEFHRRGYWSRKVEGPELAEL
jgi:hypothetical protein